MPAIKLRLEVLVNSFGCGHALSLARFVGVSIPVFLTGVEMFIQ